MISKHVATRAPCWTGEQAGKSQKPARSYTIQVEPPVVPLSEEVAKLLSDIVERRQTYMRGSANDIRKYTLHESVVAGLTAIARAEGVPL